MPTFEVRYEHVSGNAFGFSDMATTMSHGIRTAQVNASSALDAENKIKHRQSLGNVRILSVRFLRE